MNVYELDTLTLNYIRLPVDNDNRNEFSEFFLTAYNEIYRRVMAEKVKLITKELIELEKGCFSEEKLSKKLHCTAGGPQCKRGKVGMAAGRRDEYLCIYKRQKCLGFLLLYASTALQSCAYLPSIGILSGKYAQNPWGVS